MSLMSETQSLIQFAFCWPVVRRAIVLALIVGTLLILINHGTCILKSHFSFTCAWQSALTFLVPYGVSTVSSVLAMASQAGGEKP